MSSPGRHSLSTPMMPPEDPRDPGEEYLWAELRADRRTERWVALKGVIALAVVAVLVAVRQVFFS